MTDTGALIFGSGIVFLILVFLVGLAWSEARANKRIRKAAEKRRRVPELNLSQVEKDQLQARIKKGWTQKMGEDLAEAIKAGQWFCGTCGGPVRPVQVEVSRPTKEVDLEAGETIEFRLGSYRGEALITDSEWSAPDGHAGGLNIKLRLCTTGPPAAGSRAYPPGEEGQLERSRLEREYSQG